MREPRAVGWMKYFDGRIAFEKYSAFIPDDALSLGWRKLYTDDALQAAAVEAQNQQARIAELETELAQVSGYLETMTERCVTETQRNAELEQQLAELREVTRELANDVEAYADVDRHGRFAYPHIMAKWESDMEPVNRARALLQERSDE